VRTPAPAIHEARRPVEELVTPWASQMPNSPKNAHRDDEKDERSPDPSPLKLIAE
jgi:hypothetical protein